MKVVDPGHVYTLDPLDGGAEQLLVFVKRNRPPEDYPGNTNAHGGTTSQDVIRALLDRMRYVEGQEHWPENVWVIHHLRFCLWLLEGRAKQSRGETLAVDEHRIEGMPVCAVCHHVECTRHVTL